MENREKIKKICVNGIYYDIYDPSTPDYVRAITQDEIDAWNAGTEGSSNYNIAINKPSINDITLIGNKTSDNLGLQDKMSTISNMDIDNLIG